MLESNIVTFVVDRELDVQNHIIGLNVYKRNKESGFPQRENSFTEKLLLLPSQELASAEIEKSIEKYYIKKDKLISIAEDINEQWTKIEKDFIATLEKIHKFPFPYNSIKGVLASADRCGYNVKNTWFATSMFRNKFMAIDTATHELMHFMFHKYYDHVCEEQGLSKNQMWDVKESFTVLLNLEFSNFRFQNDDGYAPHAKLREVIKNSWESHHDFDKALQDAIGFVKGGK